MHQTSSDEIFPFSLMPFPNDLSTTVPSTGCGVSDRASFMQGLQHATIFSWWSTKWLQ